MAVDTLSSFEQVLTATGPLFVSMGTVMVFAYGRFVSHERGLDEYDPPLANYAFTTRYRFITALMMYIFFFELVFLGLLLLWCTDFGREAIASLIANGSTGEQLENAVAAVGNSNSSSPGSPAWAAALTTSILPPLPFFRAVDEWVRSWLYQIARIPLGARRLAKKLRAEIDLLDKNHHIKLKVSAPARTSDEFRDLVSKFLVLKALRTDLTNDVNLTPRFNRYIKILNDLSDFERRITSRFWESVSQDSGNAFLRIEADNAVKAMSRILSCALLSVEGTESDAAKLVRNWGLEIEVTAWNFRWTHAVLVFFVALVGTPIASSIGFSVASLVHPDVTAKIEQFPEFLGWGLIAAFMYLVCLVFAAGVNLIINDIDEDRRSAMGWKPRDGSSIASELHLDERLVAYLGVFLGGILLADMIVLIASSFYPEEAVKAASTTDHLLWGIPPAFVSSAFLLISSSPNFLSSRRWKDALMLCAVAIFSTLAVTGVTIGDPRDKMATPLNELPSSKDVRMTAENCAKQAAKFYCTPLLHKATKIDAKAFYWVSLSTAGALGLALGFYLPESIRASARSRPGRNRRDAIALGAPVDPILGPEAIPSPGD